MLLALTNPHLFLSSHFHDASERVEFAQKEIKSRAKGREIVLDAVDKVISVDKVRAALRSHHSPLPPDVFEAFDVKLNINNKNYYTLERLRALATCNGINSYYPAPLLGNPLRSLANDLKIGDWLLLEEWKKHGRLLLTDAEFHEARRIR